MSIFDHIGQRGCARCAQAGYFRPHARFSVRAGGVGGGYSDGRRGNGFHGFNRFNGRRDGAPLFVNSLAVMAEDASGDELHDLLVAATAVLSVLYARNNVLEIFDHVSEVSEQYPRTSTSTRRPKPSPRPRPRPGPGRRPGAGAGVGGVGSSGVGVGVGGVGSDRSTSTSRARSIARCPTCKRCFKSQAVRTHTHTHARARSVPHANAASSHKRYAHARTHTHIHTCTHTHANAASSHKRWVKRGQI